MATQLSPILLIGILAFWIPVCKASGFGDDFANNLFTDLAPLLALFGERATTQFMSQATGWSDNFLLAMAPLGIITIIVSAIRVGGPAWLKAIIGRARENLAGAEVELMSSTSQEVCEVWNKSEIVKCVGPSPICEFIFLAPKCGEGIQTQSRVKVQKWADKEVTERWDEESQPQEASANSSMEDDVKKEKEEDKRTGSGARTKSKIGDLEQGQGVLDSDDARSASGSASIDVNPETTNTSSGVFTNPNLNATNGHKSNECKEQVLPGDHEIICTKIETKNAPNISLNSHKVSRSEVHFWAFIGSIIQAIALVYAGIATYVFKYAKEETSPVAAYSFPCVASGTVTLVIGLLLCAHVIESRTSETTYKTKDRFEVRSIWIQKKAIVGDELFDAFAIIPETSGNTIKTSHRATETISDGIVDFFFQKVMGIVKFSITLSGPMLLSTETKKDDEKKQMITDFRTLQAYKTVSGTCISLLGFIVQFIGIRGIHWSVSIVQLGAILILATIRAWVRRGFADPPKARHLCPGFELEWLATELGTIQNTEGFYDFWKTDRSTELTSPQWEVVTGRSDNSASNSDQPECEVMKAHSRKSHSITRDEQQIWKHRSLPDAGKALKLRSQLGKSAGWKSPVFTEARALSRAIEITMDNLLVSQKSPFSWTLPVQYGGSKIQGATLTLAQQRNGKWKAYEGEIEAALSLWLYSTHLKLDQSPSYSIAESGWLVTQGSSEDINLRILGKNSPGLYRDLHWWMPRETARLLLKVKNVSDGNIEIKTHRVVASNAGFSPIWDNTAITQFQKVEIPETDFDPGSMDSIFKTETKKPKAQLNDKAGTGMSEYDEGEPSNEMLAVESYGSLASLYALHIFSMFMESVAQRLDHPIEGNADVQPSDASGTGSWREFTLRNAHLSKLAQEIHGTGLGSLREVYLSMLPALSARERLPRVDNIVDLTMKHANKHERLGHLGQAGSDYLWLFHTVSTFKEEGVRAKATAALFEHLRQLSAMIQMLEEQDLKDHYDFKESIGLVERTLKVKGTTKILEALMRLCEYQNRGWKCSLIPGKSLGFVDNHSEAHDRILKDCSILDCAPVHVNAARGDIESLLKLVHQGADVEAQDYLGWTPLHYAIMHTQTWTVRDLIRNNANMEVGDLSGWTPLHYASQLKGWQASRAGEMLQDLLREGADPNVQAADGTVPLHCAARLGHAHLVRSLVEAGATVDALDSLKNTPLMLAMAKGHQEVVRYLLRSANKNLRDSHGRTMLHLAALVGDIGSINSLKDLEVNALDRQKWAPIHVAASNGNARAVQALIEIGAEADAGKLHKTPLHLAAMGNHKKTCQILIENGATNSKDFTDETPLQAAASAGHTDIVRMFIKEYGDDMHVTDSEKQHLLRVALSCGNRDMVQMLIKECGADMHEKDALQQTLLWETLCHSPGRMVHMFVEEFGARLQDKNKHQQALLHVAAREGRKETVRMLVSFGANVNAQDINEATPLHSAAAWGREDTVRILVRDLGANVNAQDINKATPLHSAAAWGHEETVQILVQEYGVRVDVQDDEGKTPLHLAVENDEEGCVRMLVNKCEARFDIQDHEGNTPLDIAAPDIRKIFESILQGEEKD